MVPGPWVIVETPTRHHPRRRGRPIPRRLLLGWSERVRIRQRLRAHICAGSGRTPGATPKSNADTTQGDSTRVLRKPASFCAPTRLFRLLAPASRKNLKPHCLRGAFRCVPPRKHLKPCCVRSVKPCTYLAALAAQTQTTLRPSCGETKTQQARSRHPHSTIESPKRGGGS